MTRIKPLTKSEKIITVLYEMSLKEKGNLKFEDVIVVLFKKYKNDFHLRGYPEYPDTSNQSFYTLKSNGLLMMQNKFISLTGKGLEVAKALLENDYIDDPEKSKKMSRDIVNEIHRITKTDVFYLFTSNQKEEIVDTDFYGYLGTTVKTERVSFDARLKIIKNVVSILSELGEHKDIIKMHFYLIDEFKKLINDKQKIGFPRR